MSRQKRGDAPDEDANLPKQSARSYLVWLLSKREYSVLELERKLRLRGYEDSEIASSLAFAQSHNFQSDERFAQVKTRTSAARLGNRRLAKALKDSGIDAELIDNELENLEPEAARVVEVVARFRGKPLTTALHVKVQRFLLYRGFSSDAIKVAVAHLREHQSGHQRGDSNGDTSSVGYDEIPASDSSDFGEADCAW